MARLPWEGEVYASVSVRSMDSQALLELLPTSWFANLGSLLRQLIIPVPEFVRPPKGNEATIPHCAAQSAIADAFRQLLLVVSVVIDNSSSSLP